MSMKNYSLFWFALILSCLGRSPLLGDGLPGKWFEVRSENFTVLSNSGLETTKDIALNFEAIRALFARELPALTRAKGPRVLVFAPASEVSMQRLLPGRRIEDGQAQTAGLFVRLAGQVVIILRADAVRADETGLGIVYHEFFHHLTDQAGLELPLWLREGLAEYWGAGTRLTKKFAEIGRPVSMRLLTLQGEGLLPLPELLAADQSSAAFRDSRKRLILYSQSWALVHMILLGDETGNLERQMQAYWRLLAKGQPSLEAAQQAFGDLEKLQNRLREYSRRKLFPFAQLPLPPQLDPTSLVHRKISQGEASAHALRALLDGLPDREAEEFAQAAATDAASLTVSLEARGRLHLRRSEVEPAMTLLEQAAGRPDASPVAHYGLAILNHFQARQTAGRQPIPGEVLAKIESSLQQALKLDDQFEPAHTRLADVYRQIDQDPQRALVATRRAQAKAPEEADYRFLEARILHQFGQLEAAKKIVESEVARAAADQGQNLDNSVCWSGSLYGFPAAVMAACERAVARFPDSGDSIDSRGLAKALIGDLPAAKADFENALRLAAESWNDRTKALRRDWLVALEKGINPFESKPSPLIDDPELGGIGWSR